MLFQRRPQWLLVLMKLVKVCHLLYLWMFLVFLSLFVYIDLAYKQVSKPYQHAVWLLLFIGLLSIQVTQNDK